MLTRQILFVDPLEHEPEGARSVVGGLSNVWESTIVNDGTTAFAELEKRRFDSIVCEMKLPDMEVGEFLTKVSGACPGAVRIMLTGDPDRLNALKVSRHVHQYVPKPCKPADFESMLSNSLGVRRLLTDPVLHERIAAIGALPGLPETYNELVSELQSENSSMQKIADLIKKDVSITAKLLQMINSAFFGLPNRVESTFHAINMLGLDTVRSLVLAAGAFNQFGDPNLQGFSVQQIYDRSVAVGASAKLIAHAFGLRKRHTEDALMAGMLHDIGKLVMLSHFKDELVAANKLAQEKSLPLHQGIKEVLGVSDADIGAHLLSIWGMPYGILEAVALHYQPKESPSPMLNVLTTVHLAFALKHDEENRVIDDKGTAVDLPYLESLNLADQLPNIRNFGLAAAV